MDKIQLGMATDFGGEGSQIEKIEEVLCKIAKAGFTHIHWCHEWDGDYLYSSYEMMQIKEWMEKYHLKAKALHASKGSSRNVNIQNGHYRKDYTSDIEYNRKAGVELIKNRVDLAACIGATEIVLHLYEPHISTKNNPKIRENFYIQVDKSMDELQPYCMEKGVRICLECLFDMPAVCVENQLDRMFGKYDASFLGFCLDTGHAHMLWGNRMVEIIQKYSDRLYCVHLHDNSQTVDFHQIPGDGTIDWPTTMRAIAESKYEAPLVLELMSYDENVDEFLQKAHEAGLWINELYEKALER
ncbi:MAG: sugar phosphate isomerase/epimerase family protein [Cellulosilyticaceae bacterium]